MDYHFRFLLSLLFSVPFVIHPPADCRGSLHRGSAGSNASIEEGDLSGTREHLGPLDAEAFPWMRSFVLGSWIYAAPQSANEGLWFYAFPAASPPENPDRVRPWSLNPTYWQYKGKPVLLLGGSEQNNAFNHPVGLEAMLDVLAAAGGNYIRNTVAGYGVTGTEFPFYRDPETGFYDLDRFNDEFFQRLDDFLRMTKERDIIVQIEIFDRFEYARGPWDANPFNPANNINYTTAESRLPESITTHPNQRENPFFRSLPTLDDIPDLLAWQESLVAEILSVTFLYDHVLYCISNETNDSEAWSRHWAEFIRDMAAEEDVGVEVTEMWDAWDLNHSMHRRTFDHPELYSYVDISQNNHRTEQTHWDNMQAARQRVSSPPRPVNNIKIYGGERHGGGLTEGIHKFWRSIIGGCASARFHRQGPTPGYYGAGLSDLAQRHLRSMRAFTGKFDVFASEPRNDLLSDRLSNEAYCAAVPGREYGLYFPDGGAVTLDATDGEGPFAVRWLDIENEAWGDEYIVSGGGPIPLEALSGGQWAVVVVKVD